LDVDVGNPGIVVVLLDVQSDGSQAEGGAGYPVDALKSENWVEIV
jgi:hypothetical protein